MNWQIDISQYELFKVQKFRLCSHKYYIIFPKTCQIFEKFLFSRKISRYFFAIVQKAESPGIQQHTLDLWEYLMILFGIKNCFYTVSANG